MIQVRHVCAQALKRVMRKQTERLQIKRARVLDVSPASAWVSFFIQTTKNREKWWNGTKEWRTGARSTGQWTECQCSFPSHSPTTNAKMCFLCLCVFIKHYMHYIYLKANSLAFVVYLKMENQNWSPGHLDNKNLRQSSIMLKCCFNESALHTHFKLHIQHKKML